MGRRRVVVLRHGQTVDNAARIWQGHRDSALSEEGLEQARRAAEALARLAPSMVVSSDLARAVGTARLVAAAAGLDPAVVRLDARLREIDVGRWSGMPAETVRQEYAEVFAAMHAGQDVRWGVDGETVAELASRVGEALADVVGALPQGQTAVVVCHGVAGRTAVAGLLGMDQMVAAAVLGGVENGHWAVLTQAEAGRAGPGWVLRGWNLPSTG